MFVRERETEGKGVCDREIEGKTFERERERERCS